MEASALISARRYCGGPQIRRRGQALDVLFKVLAGEAGVTAEA